VARDTPATRATSASLGRWCSMAATVVDPDAKHLPHTAASSASSGSGRASRASAAPASSRA
jgi:hypothetical protein